MIPTGIRQSMTFRKSRKRAPARRAMAEVSPKQPPTFPQKRSLRGVKEPSVMEARNLRFPSGVAKVAVFT